MTENFEPAPFPRLIKWAALILALAALLLVVWVVVSDVANGHRADAAIAQLHDERRDQATREAADDRARQVLLTQVSDLLTEVEGLNAKYTRLANANRGLLRWLHAHGITVPTRFVVTHAAAHRSGSSRAPSGKPAQKPTPQPPPSQPAPAPTLPNGKPAPGNSGNAPGHLKH